MNYKQILNYLYSLESWKVKLGLKNIKSLLKKINNPEKKLKIIHVAGTNGKGSVCAMLSSILQEAGFKVGMYTSPHLKKFNERIRINEKLISNKEIVDYFLKIKPCITNQSFFEITTALAFLYFYEKNVDFVVLEVGLGGRLDATNVVKPLASVITNVDFEHTVILGNKIEKIAYEKAGIIKKNIPVVTGAKGKALQTIKSIAKKRNSPLITNKKYRKNNGTFNVNNYKNLKLNFLKGDFQLENASITVTTVDILNKYYNLKINKKSIEKGLKKAKWPGRFQFIGNSKRISKCQKSKISEHMGKNVLVDCAHNTSGFKVLTRELKALKNKKYYKKLVLVIGILNDKDRKKIMKLISPYADKIIITKPKSERATEPEEIKKYIKNKDVKIIKDVKKAFSYAKKIAGKKDLVLVTGSIYVVGETLD